jgi:murein DD-endopeptidase MepM/ murein hydrolase activator NlpD
MHTYPHMELLRLPKELYKKSKYAIICYMRFPKNLNLPVLGLAVTFLYVTTANAFLLDFIFGKSTNNTANNTKQSANVTVQSMEVLGEGSLNGKKDSNSIIKKLFNNDSSAFSVEQGALHSTVEIAVEEENSHTMDEIAVYTVKKGDSLASIASYFEISSDTISTFNKLENNKVKEGDVLEIPQVSGILYTIRKGDTLDRLAKDYKIDAEDISLYNAIIPGIALSVDEDVFLPGAKLIKIDTSKADKAKLAKEKKERTEKLKAALAKVKTKLGSESDKVAISKIKRFAGKYANLPQIEGYFGNPAPGAVRSQKMHGANAVDLAAPIGTNILASAGGTVSVAKSTGWNYGYGQYIVITHDNGTQTVYAHLSNIDVVPGQVVGRGEKIGNMGSTGNSTGSHVHFEVRGAYNPFAW